MHVFGWREEAGEPTHTQGEHGNSTITSSEGIITKKLTFKLTYLKCPSF